MPRPGQEHYHVCQHCERIWSHKRLPGQGREASHLCPYCQSGPYYESYPNRHDAELEQAVWQGKLRKQYRFIDPNTGKTVP